MIIFYALIFFFIVPNFVIRVICEFVIAVFRFIFNSDGIVKMSCFFYAIKRVITKDEPWVLIFLFFLFIIMSPLDSNLIYILRVLTWCVLFFGNFIFTLDKIYDYYVEIGVIVSDLVVIRVEQSELLNYDGILSIQDLIFFRTSLLKVDKLLYDGKRNISKSSILMYAPIGEQTAKAAQQTVKAVSEGIKTSAKERPELFLKIGFGATVGATATLGVLGWRRLNHIHDMEMGQIAEEGRAKVLEINSNFDIKNAQIAVKSTKVAIQKHQTDQVGVYIDACIKKGKLPESSVIDSIHNTAAAIEKAKKGIDSAAAKNVNDSVTSVVENNETSNSFFDVILIIIKKLI